MNRDPMDLEPIKDRLADARYRSLIGARFDPPRWDDVEALIYEIEWLRDR